MVRIAVSVLGFVAVALWIAVIAKFASGQVWYGEFKNLISALGPTIAIIVAAYVGFGGVIKAQQEAARLARHRDKRLRQDEARSLATALLAEVNELNDSIRNRHAVILSDYKNGKQKDPVTFEAMALPPAQIYENNCDRLGLLPDGVVTAVVNFHSAKSVMENYMKGYARHGEKFVATDKFHERLPRFVKETHWWGEQAIATLAAFKEDRAVPVVEPYIPDADMA